MSLLSILYWVLLVLAILSIFAPADIWPARYLPTVIYIALFVIIGLRIFRTPLQ